MKTTLSDEQRTRFLERLADADRRFTARYPGDSGARQPVHTVYGGAHLFRADSAGKLGKLGLRALDTHAPDAFTFARVIGLPGAEELPNGGNEAARLQAAVEEHPDAARQTHRTAWLAATIYRRVREKLEREPVEDFRIDFEDGYGSRPDDEEDAAAVRAAEEVARGLREGTLPPFIGIRIKPLTTESSRRSVRTLDLLCTALAEHADGTVPDHFVVTLPKVTMPEQVEGLAEMAATVERQAGLPEGSLKLELMIEMPQAIIAPDGGSNLPRLVEAAKGRCVGAHFGTYDYTASCNITAAHQHMTHAVCDFAKHMMQVAYAGTGIWISDGATNIMPVGPHAAPKDGPPLTPGQIRDNTAAVHRAWRLHSSHIRHSLINGFYQGWDLHPAQLPTRYGTVYSFFLDGLDAAGERLRHFVDAAAQATLAGDVFDDAATGQGLLNFFLRATGCGAITEREATELSGLRTEELRGRSFAKIIDSRRQP